MFFSSVDPAKAPFQTKISLHFLDNLSRQYPAFFDVLGSDICAIETSHTLRDEVFSTK